MADFYVRALYPFNSDDSNNLVLRKEDIILVTNVIDAEQYYGECNGKKGQFPVNFVESINLPKVNANERIFAAIGYFDGPENGDLKFKKGEIIIGTNNIDKNWCNGYKPITKEHGIFPLTHVTQLIDLDSSLIYDQFKNNKEVPDYNFNFSESSSFNDKSISSKLAIKQFKKGHGRRSSFSLANTSSYESSVTPYAKSLYAFEAMNKHELSFKENEIITLIKHVFGGWTEGEIDGKKGLFPTNYVDIIVDCLPPSKISENIEEELYGRVIYDFKATMDGEINLQEGDTVTILRIISKDYCEVHHDDGRFGYCPKSHIEIFCGEPEINSTSKSSKSPNIKDISTETFPSSKHLEVPLESLSSSTPDLQNLTPQISPIKQYSQSSSPSFLKLNNFQSRASYSSADCQSKLKYSNDFGDNKKHFANKIHLNQNFEEQLENVFSKSKVDEIYTFNKNSSAAQSCMYLNNSNNKTLKSPPPVKDKTGLKFEPRRVAPPCPQPRNFRTSSSDSDNLIEFSPDQANPTFTMASSPISGNEDIKNDLRQKIIQEIIQTERDFYESLNQCNKIFCKEDKVIYDFDASSLLGNIVDIIGVSKKLLSSFEENANKKFFEEQRIGLCFLEHSDEIRKAYALYCSNHDNVIGLLEKYKSNPEINAFINSHLDIMRSERSIFDLESILIKPIQRILKYPLFLSSLDKSTPSYHVDKTDISRALRTITEIASYINEMKRKKDLIQKYKRTSDKTGKLTMHATKKKLTRFGQMIVGVQMVDENFNKEEHKFFNLNNLVKIIVKNISQYVEHIQESSIFWEDLFSEIINFYGEDKIDIDLAKVHSIYTSIARFHLPNFRMKVETEIIPPLNSLCLMLCGPEKLIKKRYVKLLDYETSKQKYPLENNEEVIAAKLTYETLNSQLVDELPYLYELAMDIIYKSICYLVKLNAKLRLKVTEEFNEISSIQNVLLTHIEDDQFGCISSFTAFNFMHKLSSNSSNGHSLQRSLTQTDSCITPIQSALQKTQILKKYKSSDIYIVTQDYIGLQLVDLRVSKNTIVGVIKRSDPLGNVEKWLVDDSVKKGFVPCKLLSPARSFHSSQSMQENILDTPIEDLDPYFKNSPIYLSTPLRSDSHSLSPNITRHMLDNNVQSMRRSMPNFHKMSSVVEDKIQDVLIGEALYDFAARSETEISLTCGNLFTILQCEDLDKNTEWWYVMDKYGNYGYAPSNYLRVVKR